MKYQTLLYSLLFILIFVSCSSSGGKEYDTRAVQSLDNLTETIGDLTALSYTVNSIDVNENGDKNGKYKVIESPDGAVVTNIPEGGEEVDIEGSKYVVYNTTYYLPFSQNGKDMYQVVAMESAD